MNDPLAIELSMLALAIAFAAARVAGFVAFMPILPPGIGGNILRACLIVGLALPMLSLARDAIARPMALHPSMIGLFAKEVAVGAAIGLVARVPLWIAEAVGAMIDNARGAFSAEQADRSRSSEESLFADTLSRLLVAVFMQTGTFLVVLGLLYQSYRSWPMEAPLPSAGFADKEAVYGLMGVLMLAGVKFVLPFLLVCLVVDLTLAYVGIALPQAETYFLAMPIKSLLSLLLLAGLSPAYFDVLLGSFKPLLDSVFPRN